MDALQQLNLAAPITDTYMMIESMIIQRIAAQIAGNPQGLINNSSEWRIQMLARMGKLSADTAKIIASQTKGIGYDIEAAINTSVQSVLKTHDLTMTDKLSGNIRSALTMYDRQAISGKYNQVNTVMQYKAKQTYLKAVDGTVSRFDRIMQKELDNKQEHLDVLNKNAMAVTLGERSRTEAIRATIEEMSDKGIPAFIDASGREWSAEAYVNMDIRNTVKNAANATQFACIEELGQDIVLVSSHAGARPLCAPYQGKFYSLSGKSGTIRDARGREYTYEPWSSTSYGEPAGLLGINCGHTIRGASEGMFINREKQYDEKENSEEYDKVVKQRALERDIRKQKTTRNALKAAGDTEGVKEYNRKIKASTVQLEAYCDKNGLTMRRDRTEVYGYSDPGRKKAHNDFIETVAPKKPTFVPAGSIDEAESFAKSIGIRHVDYSDLPLETANLLNEAALTLPEDARPAFVGSGNNLQKVTGAKFSRSSKDYYGVHLDAQDFHFGEYPNIEYDFDGGQAVGISNYYKTADKIEKSKIKGNVEYAKRHDGHTQFFNTDGRSTGFHEMGHIYDDVKGIPDGFIKDAERWAAESRCDMLKNPHEAWAEAWGAYHTKNPDLPDYIAKYVHERTNTPLDNFGKSGIMEIERAIKSKTFDEASKYARNHLSISINGLSSVPIENINAVNNCLHRMYREVPSVSGFVDEVVLADVSEIAKSSLRWEQGKPVISIKLSRQYFATMTVSQIEQAIDDAVEAGIFSPKDGLYGVFKHESAHLAEFRSTLRKYKYQPDRVQESLELYEAATEIKSLAFRNCEIDDNDVNASRYVSSYAKSNPAEFIAECYSCETDNLLVKEVKRLLKKKWGM